MDQVEYLQATNVVRLAQAARMAGLAWKSGTPGYDKAGIIGKLQRYPSMMAACVACLHRMGRGENAPTKKPSSFLDDLEDEREAPPSSALNPPASPSNASSDLYPLIGSISQLTRRCDAADSGIRENRQKLTSLTDETQALLTLAKVQETRLQALEARKPLIINIPDKAPIKIEGGQHKSYPKLIQYLHINRRVILTGSAGTGKSRACFNAAKDFGLAFHLQTPVTMDHQYLGHRDAQGVFHETPTFVAYTQGGLLLWDEADAGLPDAMLAANPIFDGNGFATFGDGRQYKQHPDFRAVFNMNTDGNGATMQYAGRNRLDGATLARFGVRIHWEIDPIIEAGMAQGQIAWHKAVCAIRDFMVAKGIVDVNATPRHVKTGALLLNAGCPKEEILVDILKSGALSEVWTDVTRLPEVSQFLRGF